MEGWCASGTLSTVVQQVLVGRGEVAYGARWRKKSKKGKRKKYDGAAMLASGSVECPVAGGK